MKKIIGRRGFRLILTLFLFLVLVVFAVGLTSLISYGIVHHRGDLIYYEYAEQIEAVDYVVVPGALVSGGNVSVQLRTRLLRAAELYKDNLCEKIIVSGGKDEVLVMNRFLLAQGIPGESIIIDEYGIDTYNTLARIKLAFPDKKILFCTQEQYYKRAEYIIRSLDIDGRCINADLLFYGTNYKERLREYFAATKAVFEAGIFKPQPQYQLTEYPMIGQDI